jgi:hypothetical protein
MEKTARRSIAILVVCVMALLLSACNKNEYDTDRSTTLQATVIKIEKYNDEELHLNFDGETRIFTR